MVSTRYIITAEDSMGFMVSILDSVVEIRFSPTDEIWPYTKTPRKGGRRVGQLKTFCEERVFSTV